jgi:hypothetical protein
MGLAANSSAPTQVRAIAALKLNALKVWAEKMAGTTKDTDQKASLRYAASQIRLFEENPKDVSLPAPTVAPDGPPIGDCDVME